MVNNILAWQLHQQIVIFYFEDAQFVVLTINCYQVKLSGISQLMDFLSQHFREREQVQEQSEYKKREMLSLC